MFLQYVIYVGVIQVLFLWHLVVLWSKRQDKAVFSIESRLIVFVLIHKALVVLIYVFFIKTNLLPPAWKFLNILSNPALMFLKIPEISNSNNNPDEAVGRWETVFSKVTLNSSLPVLLKCFLILPDLSFMFLKHLFLI